MKKLLLLLSVVFALWIAPPADAAKNHHCIVREGDSLWKIAQRYKVPFSEILHLNRHFADVHLIYPDDKVHLPHGQGTQTEENSQSDDIQHGDQKPSEPVHQEYARQVLALVNAEREKAGVPALSLSAELSSIATLKSKDMVENNYFSHDSPTYGSPFDMLQKYGVHYRAAGENIAAGQRTPQEVMQAWMNSSGHRANILNANFDKIGVGYAEGGSYGVYWTQEFIGE